VSIAQNEQFELKSIDEVVPILIEELVDSVVTFRYPHPTSFRLSEVSALILPKGLVLTRQCEGLLVVFFFVLVEDCLD
jgi:hypothetical protein